MLGTRLRQARVARRLSLQDVATRAKVSVATLSRIERDKQGLDLNLFIVLSRILKTPAEDLLSSENRGSETDPLSAQIARMETTERTRLWRELSTTVRASKEGRSRLRNLSFEVEELLAQLDFLRDEIVSVQRRLKK